MSRRQERRPVRSLNRRTGTRRESRRLLVVTEGKRQENFSAAVSNPCFEVWLLWHFEDWTREGSSSEIQHAARRHGLGKSIPPAFPYTKHPEAKRRASRTPVDVNEIGRNPSSTLPSLLESILRNSPGGAYSQPS